MISEIVILGREIPVYGLIGILGVCLALAYALFSCKKFALDRDDTVYIFIFAAIGAVIGAKILYLMVSSGERYKDISSGDMPLTLIFIKYASGGMVFYGGLLGALAAGWYTAGRYKKNIIDFLPVLVPGFALAHGIARLGCLMVGCCYGIEISCPLSIIYNSSQIAPNNVSLFPVQGIEFVGEMIIFFILVYISRRIRHRITVLYIYILMYAPMRFCLEFFRGDAARGSVLMFSVSQWISLILVAAVLVMIYISQRKVPAERNVTDDKKSS